MPKKKKKPQEAQENMTPQEAQETTAAPKAQEAVDGRPLTAEEYAMLRTAAARKSGRPIEDISEKDALDILGIDMPDREELFSRATKRAVNRFFSNITAEQFAEIAAAAQQGESEYQQAMQAHKIGDKTAAEVLQDILADSFDNDPDIQQGFAALIAEARKALQNISLIQQSETYKRMKEGLARLAQIEREISESTTDLFKNLHLFSETTLTDEQIQQLERNTEEAKALLPYLKMAFREAQADPETAEKYAGITAAEIWELLGISTKGIDAPAGYEPLLERARQLKAEHDAAAETVAEIEQAAKDLPRIISNPTELLTYPLDKPNSKIWEMIARTKDNGQIGFDLEILTGKKGSKTEAVVYAGVNFDELGSNLTITRQLTPFDKRVYIAAAALFNGGNDIISATQIYRMMGNSGNPKGADIQKINDSLTKMGAARVYIDSTAEVEINKRYTAFKYDAALLPFERTSAYINNTLCETAIHLFREPPLITFARDRGQITGITRQLLESPVSKTEANLRLDDYLLERIGHMRNPKSKAPRKMLLATIYDRCHITSRSQKSRAPEKIKRYLDHYKKCGWIAGYTMDDESVTIQI